MNPLSECTGCKELVAAFERSAIGLEQAWSVLEALPESSSTVEQNEAAGGYERAMAAHAKDEADYLLHLSMQHPNHPAASAARISDEEPVARRLRHRR
jgi:hypothetical protein